MLGDSPGRREFFRLAGAAAFTTSLLKAAHGKVRVGFIGVGSAGSANMACAARVPGCEIAALCDLDRTALDRAAALGRKLGFGGVRASRNFRCVLADKAIDAVCISAPGPVRALMAVEAFQAGKDAWIETPVCDSVEAGVRMVEACRKHNCVAQAGAIGRSGESFLKAREIVKSGELGEICFCRMMGPGVHLLDMLQGVFDEAMPVAISAQGGPGATLATFRYPKFVASFESHAAAGGGVSFHGSKATLAVNGGGCFLYRDGAGAQQIETPGQAADSGAAHWRNFIECVRLRGRPAADIETGVRSAATWLLSGIALRKGVTLDWDEKAFTVRQSDIKQYLKLQYPSIWKLEA